MDQQSEFACHHFFGSPSSVLSLYVKYIPNLWATSSRSKHNTLQNQDHLWSNVVSRIHNFRDFLEIVRRHLQHLNKILMTTLTYPKLLGETPYFSYEFSKQLIKILPSVSHPKLRLRFSKRLSMSFNFSKLRSRRIMNALRERAQFKGCEWKGSKSHKSI